MDTKIKWNDGEGYITATYEGSGDGSAIISSDINEGIDRVQTLTVQTTNGLVEEKVLVSQEGLRQPFGLSGGGVFRIKGGGRFGVLKVGEPIEPPTPLETYTRLTYIECNGQQYIDLGYVVKEDDIIECDYILTNVASADHFLFGTKDGANGLWYELYSQTAYVRFGYSSSKSISSSAGKYSVKLQKGKVTIDGVATTIDYAALPSNTLYLFAGRQSDGDAYSRGYYRCSMFRISDTNGIVMDLIPVKRDSDGVVGMLDNVSETFYTSAEEPFIAGGELKVDSEYELIDSVTINADKIYEACVIKSNYQIEVQWQKASASGSQYLYGFVTSPHTASVTAYLGRSATWRWGKAGTAFDTNNTNKHFGWLQNGKFTIDNSARLFTAQSFTTSDTLIVGGYRDAAGYAGKQYAGKIFFFRVKGDDDYILDWYPCKRLSDGVEGFWDCVTNTFIEPIS